MTYENPLRLLRQLKGAPLACLLALSFVQQPVTARWLCAVTGYSPQSITAALEALEVLGYAACNSHRSAWRLLAGVEQLPWLPDLLEPPAQPGPDRENRDPSLEEDSIDFKDSALSLDLRPEVEKRAPEGEKRAPDPDRILAATEALFGERVYRLPQPVDPRQMLACIAEVYARRHCLNYPARAAYRNITQGNWPDEKYQDFGAYLPESFLADCGLREPPAEAGRPDPDPEADPAEPGPEPDDGQRPPPQPDPALLLPLGDGRPTALAAWQSALGQLQLEIPCGAFAAYVAPAWLSGYDPQGRIFTVAARSRYAVDWLESRLSSILTRLLTGICNQTVRVRFTAEEPR